MSSLMGCSPVCRGKFDQRRTEPGFPDDQGRWKELPPGTGLGPGLRRLAMEGKSLIQLPGVSH